MIIRLPSSFGSCSTAPISANSCANFNNRISPLSLNTIQIEASQEAASEQEKIADDQLAKRKAFFDKIKAVEDEARQSSLDAQRKQAQDEDALRQANIENAIADLDNLKRFDLDRIEQQTLLRAQAAQANIDLAALEQQRVFIKTQEGLTNLIALEQGFGIQRQQIVADYYAFFLKIHIKTDHRIIHWIIAYIYLLSQRTLLQV